MSHKPHFIKGDWLADCQSCGKTFHASELRQRWDGLKVCFKDYETRQPQDFIRGVIDTQAPPWTAPQPIDTFTSATTYTSIAGYAIAGSMIAGNTVNPGSVPSSTFTV